MPTQATYRKERSSTSWHFCMNWPSDDFDEFSSAANPPVDRLCAECAELERSEKCQSSDEIVHYSVSCSFSCLINRRTLRAKPVMPGNSRPHSSIRKPYRISKMFFGECPKLVRSFVVVLNRSTIGCQIDSGPRWLSKNYCEINLK